MRNRIERLRVYLLLSAVFLVLVIAAFIGSTRYLKHRFLAELPPKLGANVKIDSTGVTWNHTDQGRITYTIHAAKEVEHTDGKVGLHDVWIKLYGRNQDRADLIRGDEWEWDKKNGVVRAIGVVHIDLQSSAAGNGKDAGARKDAGMGKATGGQGSVPGAASGAGSGANVLHVTTRDLVYMNDLGVAATSAPIEFESGAMTGHAVGADYNSDSGVLMLHSAVSMDGRSGERAVHLDASAAELDDRDHQVQLTQARYSTPGRTAQADQATLHLRADQTLRRVQAQGNVTMQANGATVVAERVDVALNAASRAQTAVLTGGVRYSADQPLRQMRGQAEEANITFDNQASPQPQHAVFRGAVHMVERTRATDAARELWSVRELTAATVDAALAPAGPGRSELRDVEATGNAHYTAVNYGNPAHAGSLTQAHGAATTDLSADDLKAHLLAGGDPRLPPQLDTIAGRGHTLLRQVGADGVVQTSAGDTLGAKMGPAAANGAVRRAQGETKAGAEEQTVASAVLTGHVVLTRSGTAQRASHAAGASGVQNTDSDTQRATGQRAVYDGDLDRATLTGGVELTGQGSELWANQIALDRGTGDAHAQGAVKVDYVQSAAQRGSPQAGSLRGSGSQDDAEPTHILADRADLVHATDVATFHGRPARLWRGGSQVQAPVIELARTQKRLIARSENAAGPDTAQVHTVLMNAGGSGTGPAQTQTAAQANTAQPCASASANTATGKPGASAGAQQTAMRVTSGGLVYSHSAGEADFTGGFRAETADGTIRASQGIVYLDTDGGAAAGVSLAGNLDRMVASGQVALDGTGLRATGERLLYTAGDRVFLLTGDAKDPPRAVDARGTTTTGAALRFHHGCGENGDTVEALGALPGEPAQHAHTVSRVSDAKKEKAGQ